MKLLLIRFKNLRISGWIYSIGLFWYNISQLIRFIISNGNVVNWFSEISNIFNSTKSPIDSGNIVNLL